jgi:hypothetical protein
LALTLSLLNRKAHNARIESPADTISESGISSRFKISSTKAGNIDRTTIFSILSVVYKHRSKRGFSSDYLAKIDRR